MNWTGGRKSKIQANRDQIFRGQQRSHQRPLYSYKSVVSQMILAQRGRSYTNDYSSDISRTLPVMAKAANGVLNIGSTFDSNLGSPQVCAPTRKAARLECIEMLQSSFDWLGKEFMLQPPKEVQYQTNQDRHLIQDYDFISVESINEEVEEENEERNERLNAPVPNIDSEDQEELINDLHSDTSARDNVAAFSTSEVSHIEVEDEEEEEPLLVPARHLAICKAVRIARENKAKHDMYLSAQKSPDIRGCDYNSKVQSDSPPEISSNTFHGVKFAECVMDNDNTSTITFIPQDIFRETVSQELFPANQKATMDQQLQTLRDEVCKETHNFPTESVGTPILWLQDPFYSFPQLQENDLNLEDPNQDMIQAEDWSAFDFENINDEL